jgi:riboflavin biosynthesis pyrimidine reductase
MPKNETRGEPATFAVSWDGRMIEPGEGVQELAAAGRLGKINVLFRPKIIGGKSLPPITGLPGEFLPRGVELELLKIERRPEGIRASYRVRRK